MPIPYAFTTPQDSAPAVDAVAVTPSDAVDLAAPCRSIYIGGTGDVSVITDAGSTVSFLNAQAGSILPIMVKRVRVTGTSATGILALY